MDSTATAALDQGLVQGPLGSLGWSSRQPNREFWAVRLSGGQPSSFARWRYLIINPVLDQTGPSYKLVLSTFCDYACTVPARTAEKVFFQK
jgi:hypothetical protein